MVVEEKHVARSVYVQPVGLQRVVEFAEVAVLRFEGIADGEGNLEIEYARQVRLEAVDGRQDILGEESLLGFGAFPGFAK